MLGKLVSKVFGKSTQDTQASDKSVAQASLYLSHGDLQTALNHAQEAVALSPSNVKALTLLGILFAKTGNLPASLHEFRKALAFDKKNIEALFNYATVLEASKEFEEAELALRQLLSTKPESVPAQTSLGKILLELDRPEEAQQHLNAALALAPTDTAALNALGLAKFRMNDFAGAAEVLIQTRALSPLDIDGLFRLGASLVYTGRFDEAEATLNAALELAPEQSTVLQMLAFKHLLSGDWDNGLRLYEKRLDAMRENPEQAAMKEWLTFIDNALAGTPLWKGDPIRGKRILVWMEQGQGDAIMMMRLVAALKQDWGATEVALLCAVSIQKLLEEGGTGIRFIKANTAWRAGQGEFDAHCSIMSLPYLMGARPGQIPGTVPYIHVPQLLKQIWKQKLADIPGLKVGLAWAGNRNLRFDELRSIHLDQFDAMLSLPGIRFFSLQKDEDSRSELQSKKWPLLDRMGECQDFMDTAALIESLDLIISVDTAVAHLAGALGKPVWLLNRFESEWRWMRGHEDSVWYPSMRIFNQTVSRNWLPILGRMRNELDFFRQSFPHS